MEMFKNLTPHEIKVETATGTVSIPASGTVARVETSSQDEAIFNGIRVVSNKADRVVGMPCPPEPCLVSGMVLDLLGSEWAGIAFAPDTGATAVRNEKGHIVAVTQLRTVRN